MFICTVRVFGVFVFEFVGATIGETPLLHGIDIKLSGGHLRKVCIIPCLFFFFYISHLKSGILLLLHC